MLEKVNSHELFEAFGDTDELAQYIYAIAHDPDATAGKSIAARIQSLLADERAHRIATEAAEELIRTEGRFTDNPNEFIVPPEWLGDERVEDCLEHLKWAGQCVVLENGEDTTVLLGDYSMESLA